MGRAAYLIAPTPTLPRASRKGGENKDQRVSEGIFMKKRSAIYVVGLIV